MSRFLSLMAGLTAAAAAAAAAPAAVIADPEWSAMCTRDLVVPAGTTSIPPFAFKDCQALVYATIPDSVTEIGKEAFKNCGNLISVAIPASVVAIGDSAFFNAYKLVNYTGGQGVREFGNCLLYTSPSPRDMRRSRMPSSA